MDKIEKIQERDFVEEGYKEVKGLIKELSGLWQNEEKY